MRERDQFEEKVTVEPTTVEGQATENPDDEAKILADQDETQKQMDAESEDIGDRPEAFVSGEVDVKEQMDRNLRAADAVLKSKAKKYDVIYLPDHLP